MIDSILNEGKTYLKFEKYKFISKLQETFEYFKKHGDTFLNSYEAGCGSCDTSKSGFAFVGNVSKRHLSVLYETEDNRISDLGECSLFKSELDVETLGDWVSLHYYNFDVNIDDLNKALWEDDSEDDSEEDDNSESGKNTDEN